VAIANRSRDDDAVTWWAVGVLRVGQAGNIVDVYAAQAGGAGDRARLHQHVDERRRQVVEFVLGVDPPGSARRYSPSVKASTW
jgi:hypothetical protein